MLQTIVLTMCTAAGIATYSFWQLVGKVEVGLPKFQFNSPVTQNHTITTPPIPICNRTHLDQVFIPQFTPLKTEQIYPHLQNLSLIIYLISSFLYLFFWLITRKKSMKRSSVATQHEEELEMVDFVIPFKSVVDASCQYTSQDEMHDIVLDYDSPPAYHLSKSTPSNIENWAKQTLKEMKLISEKISKETGKPNELAIRMENLNRKIRDLVVSARKAVQTEGENEEIDEPIKPINNELHYYMLKCKKLQIAHDKLDDKFATFVLTIERLSYEMTTQLIQCTVDVRRKIDFLGR